MKRVGLSDRTVTEKLFLLILFVLPCLLISRNLNNDIWFLLNSGRYVIANGIPRIEPFTIHSGMTFVMQQWLSAMLFWLIYSTFGFGALHIFIIAVFLGIIAVIYKLCKLLSDGNILVSYGISFFVCTLISLFMTQRPYIFTALIISIEILMLERYIACDKKVYIVVLPILSLLLINLHASMWPMLFVIMIPYFIDAFRFKFLFLKGQGYTKKYLVISLACMFLAGFINPYGFSAMTYLFRSYGYAEISTFISEMKPPNINAAVGMMIFGSILAVTLIYCLYKKGTTRLRYILLTMGMAYLTISSVRNQLFFAICGFFPLSHYLKDVRPREENIPPSRKTLILRTVLIVFISCATILGFIYKGISPGDGNLPDESKAIDYLLQIADVPTTVLYTGYNAGGYAEYKGYKTYIDPRAEVFVKDNNGKDDIMKEYHDLQAGDLYYADFLNKYNFTHLLVSKNDMLYNSLKHDTDYDVIYEDDSYTIFLNKALS